MELIASHIDKMVRGEFDRLAIFMPPRHAKTETVTIRAPVYLLAQNPALRILVTGYNERIARKFSRKARNIAQDLLQLAQDKKAADEWETVQGGGLVARGVGTPPMGFGFNWIFIDDPIKKREEAESSVFREKVWDWYTDDLYTRLEPGGKLVLTLTRWHHDDIAGRALESEPGKWTVLKLSAIAEEADAIGRKPGEALWPERYSVKSLERIKAVMTKQDGTYSFESLFQQNPTPREGAFFKTSQIEIVDAAPKDLKLCRAWDFAASDGTGDFTAGLLMGVDRAGLVFILDLKHGQWGTDERDNILLQTAQLDGDVAIRIPIDPGQAGIDQSKRLIRLLAGRRIRAQRVTGSKTTRADGLASQVNAGNVRLIKASWNAVLIEEFRQFPLGKHDDIVDAASDAFQELTGRKEITVLR